MDKRHITSNGEFLKKERLGFTLIEILVVIAIIAVLAGLLMPVLARAKRKAQAVYCLNNVRQWGLAIDMYSDEHVEYFPYEGNPGAIDSGKNLHAWYNVVTPYLNQPSLSELYEKNNPPVPGSRSVFTCPNTASKPPTPLTAHNAYFMYGFNRCLDPDDVGPTWLQFRRYEVQLPSSTAVLADNSETYFPTTSGRFTPARHFKYANLSFVDGHAEAVHTNDYARTLKEDTDPHDKYAASKLEWSKERKVYWFPFSGAPE